jgi:serine/threonine-protein kinase
MREVVPGKSVRGRRGKKHRATINSNFPVSSTRRMGQLIDRRYLIEGLLGTGTTSNVYLCVDVETKQQVVVKQLTSNASTQEEIKKRFLSEAHALRELNHPNIVRVFNYGAPANERPYLVMEALCGESLKSLLLRRPKPTLELALLVVRQTALGLELAHRLNVVHRDIKPDNLFILGPIDDPFCVKIIDFGMAKIPQSNGSSGVNTVLGTVEYMAPEQVMADPVDARTDVYGLGMLLFRMLTGRLAFESEEGMELLTHQLFSAVPRTSWVCDHVSPSLEQVVAKATCKHPDNRFQSMGEFIQALDQATKATSVDPEPLFLRIEPDVYEPQNPKGREVATLLAERYQSIAPPGFESQVPQESSHVEFETLDPADLEPLPFDLEQGA